jgi:hypothetical protein
MDASTIKNMNPFARLYYALISLKTIIGNDFTLFIPMALLETLTNFMVLSPS